MVPNHQPNMIYIYTYIVDFPIRTSIETSIDGISIYIWVNHNISLTWIKAHLGMISLINYDSRVRSQWGRYNLPRYIYIYHQFSMEIIWWEYMVSFPIISYTSIFSMVYIYIYIYIKLMGMISYWDKPKHLNFFPANPMIRPVYPLRDCPTRIRGVHPSYPWHDIHDISGKYQFIHEWNSWYVWYDIHDIHSTNTPSSVSGFSDYALSK